MPDEHDKNSKTEAASRYKLKKSREEGSVAKSQDLSGTVGFIAGLIATMVFLPQIGKSLVSFLLRIIYDFPLSELSMNGIKSILVMMLKEFIVTSFPLLTVIWVAALATTVAQVGFHVSFKPLEPKLDKINPVNGFKRLFSTRSVVSTALAILKMLLVVFVSGSVIWNNRQTVSLMNLQNIDSILNLSGRLTWELCMKAACTLLFLALIDFAYQKWQFLEDQKMTKQEVKEEHKHHEGNPMIKGQVRARQKAAAKKRGLKESVEEADVIVTNPFHIAVALKYDREHGQSAPIVVAKGARLLAERIKQFAKEFKVEIVPNIPLARALYKECKVGMEISPDLYIAVAEVLAIVYAKRNKNK
jgi:flagellar biosynthetic protein FlhB